MTLQQIVREWLKANGYDGLCDCNLECGCSVDDIMPCAEPGTECEAGYQKKGDKDSGYDFVIVPGRKPDTLISLVNELNSQITTVHLDMGGQNRYTLGSGAHKLIDKLKVYLYEHRTK